MLMVPDTLLGVLGPGSRTRKVLLMRRFSPLRLLSTTLLGVAGAGMATSGCADNESSLFIAGVMLPEDDCVFEPDESATLLFSGIMDVAVARTYAMPLLIGNQLIARGDAEKLRTETARIVIRGAVVTVLAVAGNTVLDSFTTNASGFVHPSSGENPGYGVSLVNAIPQRLNLALAAGETRELNIAVNVFGDTLGGDEVESSTFTFPVFACNGCLLDCSTANPADGTCDFSAEADLDVGCFPGQDGPVPCQYYGDTSACAP